MAIFSFYIFDRHTECVYTRLWKPTQVGTQDAPSLPSGRNGLPSEDSIVAAQKSQRARDSDTSKLIFGTVFSLRNMVRKLGGDDDAFISYRTGQYRLHYYETPANLRFVMLTDTTNASMRNVLHQIYINLWVEYVVKNPLAPVEHSGGAGINNELFELGLEQFVRGLQ